MASTVPTPFLPVALIVDSDADSAEMYAVALSLEGFTTVEAHDASQAVDWLVENRPTVVVTELCLSGAIDGLALIRRLRENEHSRDVPVVVVTANASMRAREAARRHGCDVFLAKPCLPEDLTRHVHALVSQRNACLEAPTLIRGSS